MLYSDKISWLIIGGFILLSILVSIAHGCGDSEPDPLITYIQVIAI